MHILVCLQFTIFATQQNFRTNSVYAMTKKTFELLICVITFPHVHRKVICARVSRVLPKNEWALECLLKKVCLFGIEKRSWFIFTENVWRQCLSKWNLIFSIRLNETSSSGADARRYFIQKPSFFSDITFTELHNKKKS